MRTCSKFVSVSSGCSSISHFFAHVGQFSKHFEHNSAKWQQSLKPIYQIYINIDNPNILFLKASLLLCILCFIKQEQFLVLPVILGDFFFNHYILGGLATVIEEKEIFDLNQSNVDSFV